MIIDLNGVDVDPFAGRNFDVCICGAGIAGITLALKLSKKLRVVLLEGGGFGVTAESHDLYKGKSVGQKYFKLNTTRLRFFGGTSNHWGGWCTPMDNLDFTTKSYVKYSGWPIGRNDLQPYFEEAESILDITNESVSGQSESEDDPGNMVTSSGDFSSVEFKFSPPTRFAVKYRDVLEKSPNIVCYLNANIVDMQLGDSMSSLEYVEVSSFTGKSYQVHATTFVLAAGGIENPRILLNCNKQIEAGIGNSRDLVGRFFTEHPNKISGNFILEDRAMQHVTKHWVKSPSWYSKMDRYFSPTLAFMQREKIMNFGIFIEYYQKPDHSNSFKHKLQSVICDSDLALKTYKAVRGYPMSCRPGDGSIRVVAEQVLNPSSRIYLDTETDKFGIRRAILDWRLSEIDLRTLKLAVFRLAEVFASAGIGRIQIADWLLSENIQLPDDDGLAGHHHMCTTRMASSPDKGVVDLHQRVFGVDNLYVGGSSAFATSGHDSPTITIVQMTLRLADHLNNKHAVLA